MRALKAKEDYQYRGSLTNHHGDQVRTDRLIKTLSSAVAFEN